MVLQVGEVRVHKVEVLGLAVYKKQQKRKQKFISMPTSRNELGDEDRIHRRDHPLILFTPTTPGRACHRLTTYLEVSEMIQWEGMENNIHVLNPKL